MHLQFCSHVLVKVVRDRFCFCDEQRLYAFGADRNNVVLILQNSFDGEESLTGQQQAILMKQIRTDNGVCDSGFIFQAQKYKSLGGAGTLAGNNAASDAETLARGQIAQFAGAPNAHGTEPCAAVGHGMRANRESGAVKIGDQSLLVIHRREW